MSEVVEKKFVSWKKSQVGTTRFNILVRHEIDPIELLDINSYNRLNFNVTLIKNASVPCYHLQFVATMVARKELEFSQILRYSCKPVLENCSAKITLLGPNGTLITRRFHFKMAVHCCTVFETPTAIKCSEYQDPYFFHKGDLIWEKEDDRIEKLKSELCISSAEVEIFGHLSILRSTLCVVPETNAKYFNSDKISAPTFLRISNFPFSLDPVKFELETVPVDAKFIFPKYQDEIIESHSYVLAVSSPVLRKMLFETPMKEKETKTIEIKKDITPEAMRSFLRLVYNKGINENLADFAIDEALQVIPICHYYEVKDVIEFCTLSIMCKDNDQLVKEDLHEIFNVGHLYDLPDLKTRCFHWLQCKKESTATGFEEVNEFLKSAKKLFLMEFCQFLMRK